MSALKVRATFCLCLCTGVTGNSQCLQFMIVFLFSVLAVPLTVPFIVVAFRYSTLNLESSIGMVRREIYLPLARRWWCSLVVGFS